MSSKNNLPACKDGRGLKDCFAKRTSINGKSLCICLSDTTQVPCPFYKSKDTVEKGDN